jgi:hypothetical protein
VVYAIYFFSYLPWAGGCAPGNASVDEFGPLITGWDFPYLPLGLRARHSNGISLLGYK